MLAGAVQCRELQIDLTLSQFTQAALVKAGATTATLNARRTALQAYQTALCTANGTAAQLQTALADYLTRTLETRDQIASAIRTAAPA